MYNKVVLVGRLVRDPELRYTGTGKAVCNFTLAVDRSFKNASGEKEADFIPIIVWGAHGENCNTYLAKGKLALVDGRMQTRNYEAKDGTKKYVTEVVASDVRFLSPRDPNQQSNDSPEESKDSNGDQKWIGDDNKNSGPANNDISMGDDDLPF